MKEDWIEAALGEVFETVTGNTPSKKDKDNYGSEIPFIKPPQINNNFLKTSTEFLSVKGKIKARILPINSVLVTCIGNLGRIGINKAEVSFNQQINAIKPISSIEPKYTFYQAQSVSFRNQLEKLSTSTTVALVNKTSFNSVKFKIAPLPIQKAIVKKIEELFSSLNSGIADLKKAQDQLVIYRQAVLKKAFEGELTKKWRKKQTNLPSADELLEQIKEERQKNYDQQLAVWKEAVKHWEANGKKYRKPIRPVKLINIEVDLNNQFSSINWLMIEMSIVSELIDPQPSHRTPPVEDDGIPFISTANFNRETGVIDFKGARKVSKEVLNDQISLYKLIEGDFVIGKIGTVGKPFVIPSKRFFTLSANLVLVQTNRKICSSKYLIHLIKSNFIQGQFRKGTNSTTQGAFGIKKFRLLKIPIPNLKEQHQIVQEIESRLSVCDKVEENIKESLQKAQALRQSILKKAFEGKLLSEEEIAKCKSDKEYEPASVLLERIKAEKK